ncbi:DUF192 domain-containing protein [Halobellus rarus]|uniref:DUF192 domain-containing protein n=1 Tax=Halobellus rarus TaxID=1126237 RepID=A0ABD6CI36_9EURY|nr:DUF192 domain-containing protein [Halobellus rarus]
MADRSRFAAVVLAIGLLLAVGIVAVASNPGLLPTGEYERTTVDVLDAESGETLASVTVRVADTRSKRYTGLSETDSLGANEGMLFVHGEEDEYAYVMRGMAFPIDIVFVDSGGTITAVHHAEPPPEGTSGSDLTRYRGRGQYVLEVPYNYTVEHGIEAGDRVEIAGEWGPSGGS